MNIVFFAARKVHKHYFSLLAAELNGQGEPAEVLWHKTLWMDLFWLRFFTGTYDGLPELVNDHIREKKNSRKGRGKSALYWKLFTILKRTEAQLLASVYKQALARSQSRVLVLWNGLKFRQRIVASAARSLGVNTIVMENGLLPGMTTIDPAGVNYLNSVPREGAYFASYSGQWVAELPPLPDRPDDIPDSYIFIPFQVNTDSQVVMFSPWIKDMFALTEALLVAERALGEKMPFVILKTHPACDQDYSELHEHLARTSRKILLRSHGDTQAFIRHANAVATINSTVGIEAIIANVRTIVFGQAFYNIPGLTMCATNQQELQQALTSIPEFCPNPTIRNGFLAYLRNEYQIPGRWQSADQPHISAACKHLLSLVNNCD